MATNKHATIRYHALDRCFSNFGRRFYIDDLIEACNEALYEFAGIEDGVKRRQIFDDISFMESEQGWFIPLQKIRDGRRVYYRYEDKNFSIKNKGINPSEAEQLKETLSILSRFKGLPQFDWVAEMQIRLEDTFHLKGSTTTAVSFEQNPYLKGLNHFTELFNAIQNQTSLRITYQSYKESVARTFTFHPWHLKQYNNRWFVFGFNEELNIPTWNLALDRIESIEATRRKYQFTDIDWNEYFYDIVGVTRYQDKEPESIVLDFTKDVAPYVETKPIHPTQKSKWTDAQLRVTINVIPNYELMSMILSFGEKVKVISPQDFKDQILNRIKSAGYQY